MKKTLIIIALTPLIIGFFMLSSCTENKKKIDSKDTVTKVQVIKNYADIVYTSYKDSYDKALIMKTAIDSFAANPTKETLQTAKDAWIAAREPYGQTEVFRESNGPIDTAQPTFENGLDIEGQMNAWPLDEAYIDYVTIKSAAYAGKNTGGFIGDKDFEITKESIAGKNEEGGDKNVSTGWHAIEFLLWGQDETSPKEAKAGQRPLTDYTTDANKDRRISYLITVTNLLINDLKSLVNIWAPEGNYRKEFLALDKDEALTNVIKGSFFLAGEELSVERMSKPADSVDGIDESGQEDEHSCFSDNTHRDIYGNAQGIVNVVYGKYRNIEGASFYELVKQTDTEQAEKLKTAIDEMMTAINAIDAKAKKGTHFDQMLVEETSISQPKGIVMTAVVALKKVADEISASATKVGISLN